MGIKQTTVRFSEAYFFQPNTDVLVLGLGGIGSWLAINLSRLDANIYMYDMDIVDEVNIAGQAYGIKDVGLLKARAAYDLIHKMSDSAEESVNVVYFDQKYDDNGITCPITFSCFDNMSARKIAFEKWAAEETRELFIDGRMALATGEIYCVTKGLEDEYRKTLFDDSEVEEAACSMKATTFSGMLISSLMTGIFCNYIGLKKNPDYPLSMPFKTSYNIPLMNFET